MKLGALVDGDASRLSLSADVLIYTILASRGGYIRRGKGLIREDFWPKSFQSLFNV